MISVRWYEHKKIMLCGNRLSGKTYGAITSEKNLFHDTDSIVTDGLNIFRSGCHSKTFYREI